VLRDIFQVLCQFMPEEGGPELQPSRRPRAAGGGFSPRAGVPGPEPQRPHRPAATLAGGAGQATVPAAAGQPAGHGGGRVAAAAAGAGPVGLQPDRPDPVLRGARQPEGSVAGPELAEPGPVQPQREPAHGGRSCCRRSSWCGSAGGSTCEATRSSASVVACSGQGTSARGRALGAAPAQAKGSGAAAEAGGCYTYTAVAAWACHVPFRVVVSDVMSPLHVWSLARGCAKRLT
jgi:hypothetical protein